MNEFNHLGFNSPPLAASCHSGESRNPEIYTGCRIRSGMTSDTPLLCGGVVHHVVKNFYKNSSYLSTCKGFIQSCYLDSIFRLPI
jgi:hypothetical protein